MTSSVFLAEKPKSLLANVCNVSKLKGSGGSSFFSVALTFTPKEKPTLEPLISFALFSSSILSSFSKSKGATTLPPLLKENLALIAK